MKVDPNVNYFGLNFQQLCEVNMVGGHPRLYEILKDLFTNKNDEDEELTKLFSRQLLTHLVSRIGQNQPLGIRQNAQGKLVFMGFPNGDYIR